VPRTAAKLTRLSITNLQLQQKHINMLLLNTRKRGKSKLLQRCKKGQRSKKKSGLLAKLVKNSIVSLDF